MSAGTTSRAFALVFALAAGPPAAAQAVLGGALPAPLPLFPLDNWWNADVSSAPKDPNSDAYISHIGGGTQVHPDWGGDANPGVDPSIYGMPYIVVPGDQPLETIASFTYPDQSDAGAPGRPTGYPIPVAAKTDPYWIEGGYPGNSGVGGDKHMLIVDKDHRLLFELWNTSCSPTGSSACTWSAGSGAVFSLDSNHRRPDTWTSADAAGLAVFPGLVRYDEAYGSAPIRHAFRVTVQNSNGYVYPASHNAGSTSGALPMGARLRLKSSTTTTQTDPGFLRVFQALKTYGLIVADNGSNMFIQGTYDTRWDMGVLNTAFGSLNASDFEVVQLGWKPSVSLPHGPLQLHALTPCRILDTRNAPGAYGAPALWPGWERSFMVFNQCGIPQGARALVANVTAVFPPAYGHIHLFPGDLSSTPMASTIELMPGRIRANNALIGLSSAGVGTFVITNESSGTADVLVDVSGYFR